MTTETAAPTFQAAPQAEGQVKAAEGAEQKPLVPEQPDKTDWKAKAVEYRTLAEQQQAARQKAEKDASSLKGELRQQAQQGARIDDIWRALKLSLAHDEGAVAEVEKIEAESRTRAASSGFLARHDTLLERLQQSVMGEDGKPVLDLYNAPELADVREEWNAAGKVGDAAELALVVAKAERLARTAERGQKERELVAARSDAAKARQEAARERGELDLGGEGAPVAAESAQALVNRLAAGADMTPAQMVAARKAMDGGVYPQRKRS